MKKGINLGKDKGTVCILTKHGEICRIQSKEDPLKVGQIVAGRQKMISARGKIILSLGILLLISAGIIVCIYSIPTTIVKIYSKPVIQITSNRWNRVIRYKGLNEDGEKLVRLLELKNKDIEDSTILILQKAMESKYLQYDKVNKGNPIRVEIVTRDGKQVNLPKVEKYVAAQKLDTEIRGVARSIENEKQENTSNKREEQNDRNDKEKAKEISGEDKMVPIKEGELLK